MKIFDNILSSSSESVSPDIGFALFLLQKSKGVNPDAVYAFLRFKLRQATWR